LHGQVAYRAVGTDKAAHVLHNAKNGDSGLLAKIGLTADIGKRHTLKWERGAQRQTTVGTALCVSPATMGDQPSSDLGSGNEHSSIQVHLAKALDDREMLIRCA
jgi:ABC-type histidine transport system ATPase subunit